MGFVSPSRCSAAQPPGGSPANTAPLIPIFGDESEAEEPHICSETWPPEHIAGDGCPRSDSNGRAFSHVSAIGPSTAYAPGAKPKRQDEPTIFFVAPGGELTADGVAAREVQAFAPEPEDIRRAREARIAAQANKAQATWAKRARQRQWDQVFAPLSVYRFAGKVASDPRQTQEYRKAVIEGLRLDDPSAYPHLSAEDLAAVREVCARKAGAFWLKDTPRTTIRGVVHDTITIGAPVRSPPMRLKGAELQNTEDGIRADVERGQLERGNSPWGSWAFPVRGKNSKIRIVVVDYRRINARTVRAVYYLRRGNDIKQECLGSIYFTLLDAVSGFNQVPNTRRASKVLAILAASGCYLPRCLTMGPTNGPEDFSFVVDTLFSMGKMHKRRLNKQWQVYIDDFCCRSGRWRHGNPITDAALESALLCQAPCVADRDPEIDPSLLCPRPRQPRQQTCGARGAMTNPFFSFWMCL